MSLCCAGLCQFVLTFHLIGHFLCCVYYISPLLCPFRFHPPLVSWSTLCLWSRLPQRRNPGSQSRAPSRAPWPAALNVGCHSFLQSRRISSCFVFCDVGCNLLLSSPACEDVLTPAAVAELAMKVLNSCLATMPAGKIQLSWTVKTVKALTKKVAQQTNKWKRAKWKLLVFASRFKLTLNIPRSKMNSYFLHPIMNDKQSFKWAQSFLVSLVLPSSICWLMQPGVLFTACTTFGSNICIILFSSM